ncbi:hypothetical protein [Kitasatospora griseola]|nr:hypothetical protein [Kitasatospora griseola]
MTAPADQDRVAAELDDDWPDHDTRRYMLRRGRWKPVDDLPDIDGYQPAA